MNLWKQPIKEVTNVESFKLLPAGDRAAVADFGNVIDEAVNRQVNRLKDLLLIEKIAGIEEMVPAFSSLLILYNPQLLKFTELGEKLKKINLTPELINSTQKKILEIPCCYGGEYGEDLTDLAKLSGLSEAEIIKIHSSRDYRVYMLGFLPGFVYLGGLDERIAAPRLKTPRVAIPAGSVGIGGDQTGVYPIASPGGWRLIGKTPVKFYDPARKQPILCQAGDYIRFVPITANEYNRLAKEEGAL